MLLSAPNEPHSIDPVKAEVVLEIRDLHRCFDQLEVLRGISLRVDRGEGF
jgi:ABC-type histidine transport system ATPase subunit